MTGTTAATVSVQIEDKAVALDIYSVRKRQSAVSRTIEDGYEKIGRQRRICMYKRLADRIRLEKGQPGITVSPYGSDDEYELTVIAGVIEICFGKHRDLAGIR